MPRAFSLKTFLEFFVHIHLSCHIHWKLRTYIRTHTHFVQLTFLCPHIFIVFLYLNKLFIIFTGALIICLLLHKVFITFFLLKLLNFYNWSFLHYHFFSSAYVRKRELTFQINWPRNHKVYANPAKDLNKVNEINSFIQRQTSTRSKRHVKRNCNQLRLFSQLQPTLFGRIFKDW